MSVDNCMKEGSLVQAGPTLVQRGPMAVEGSLVQAGPAVVQRGPTSVEKSFFVIDTTELLEKFSVSKLILQIMLIYKSGNSQDYIFIRKFCSVFSGKSILGKFCSRNIDSAVKILQCIFLQEILQYILGYSCISGNLLCHFSRTVFTRQDRGRGNYFTPSNHTRLSFLPTADSAHQSNAITNYKLSHIHGFNFSFHNFSVTTFQIIII